MKNSERILVIGGGPAGASAAYFLAKAGMSVTLWDKAFFPREKTCGDAVSAKAFYTLFRMGIKEGDVFPEHQSISDIALFDWNGEKRNLLLPPNLFGNSFQVIPRKNLDHTLLQKAKEAGAEVVEGRPVQEILPTSHGFRAIHSKGEETFRILIGADGIHSQVASSVFGRKREKASKSFAMRAYIRDVHLSFPHSYYFIYQRNIFPGYAWIFPLPGGRANVGFGFPCGLEAKGEFQPFTFWNSLLENPILRSELQGGIWESEPKGHYIPMRVGRGPLYLDRAFLCGDAAGLVDPITGDGIDLALESGALVAEDIIRAFRSNRADLSLGEYYQEVCEKNIRMELRRKEGMKYYFFRKQIFGFLFGKRSERYDTDLSKIILGNFKIIDLMKLFVGRIFQTANSDSD
ncbi:NAD(P)/FAD-dependent oxidoreductase [Leptospira langatensis]|uniref:NAD(P)/FAD-dependent oxidoreductase n=1 Tax=Leptospira langatensis TaxID=2484983 RepID=A0A5F1ZRE2_9LEPT|nr:NAD(P)/FAD-dependent oxidoreductase [Leptospira langatensis]TGK02564.1 NAD(P)/FAD-dependent oxidoreductase [Leptospira langatensis]TGL40235.1 NAD(P)/FAD-dependent oxidoreductase [Leptospira langatensis]